MASLRVLLLLSLLSRTSSKFTGSFTGVLWRGGFESGSIQPDYSEIVGSPPPGRTEIIEDGGGLKPRCGGSFLHVKLNGQDTAYNHNRVEIGFHPNKQLSENQDGLTRYYGWSMAHDKDKPISSTSTYELAYWESYNDWRQTIGFYMSDGRTLKLRIRGWGGDKDVGVPYNWEPGKWIDCVLGIKWSAAHNGGWVTLWINGKQVVQETAHQTMLSKQNAMFSHLGLFRIPRVNDESEMYYDCVVYAEGYKPEEDCYDDNPEGRTPCGGGGGDDDDGGGTGGGGKGGSDTDRRRRGKGGKGSSRRRGKGGGSRRRRRKSSD